MSEKLLPPVFRKDAPFVVTYPYSEISDGVGMQEFQGTEVKVESTRDYLLSTLTSTHSNDIMTTGTITSGTSTKVIDLDFDVPFNLPRTMEGEAIISGTLGSGQGTTDSGNEAFIIFTLIKSSGGTPANIGSAVQTETITFPNIPVANVATSKVLTIDYTIPNTNFKKDDILRLNVAVWAKKIGGDGSTIAIMHDPMNRNDEETTKHKEDAHTSKLPLQIPFLLDRT